ncbi:GTP-binding protein [Chelativorans sp. M5D2P16]|uniref:CobW family GTP-binding protein n=1 Tax=Chelativorans sp. M5D2P16 TaxID=3095678 RepID=UPI002ACAD94E|nr:GTP-binding protein [Chelativorans sp. M5D2P16]MDZ5699088.1 GTP-binding protein [Chelativorans sp. M5D2P16]
MALRAPIALTVLTGFLGAGKTTLLNRLLKDPSLAGTAVIVNEFGEISLDHLLVERASDGIIELGDGCLCCTVRGALVDTLSAVAERGGTLRRVIVETTGLADPLPVLQAIMAHPALSHLYRIESVVTVVDAVNGAATLAAHEEARRQVAVADRLVLTKSDLADAGERQDLVRALRALNGEGPLLDAQAPETVSAALLAATGRDRGTDLASGHGEDGHEHHHHDDHAHETAFQMVSLRHDRPLPRAAVENFLDLLATQQGDRILRIKGLVETAEDPAHPMVIQGAQRLLHRPEFLESWPDGDRGTRIVVIGHALDTTYVERIFAAFAGQAAVDTPDRAALEQNPLSVPGARF